MFESLDRVRVSFLFVKERVEDIVEIETFLVFQRESLLTARINVRAFLLLQKRRSRRSWMRNEMSTYSGRLHMVVVTLLGERFPRNVKLRRFTNYGHIYIHNSQA